MQGNTKYMRLITPVIVAAAIAAVVLINLRQPEKTGGGIELVEGAIRIEKDGVRLADIARALNDPDVLSYDEAAHRARTVAHIVVMPGGSLTIGSDDQPEVLEFDTNVCDSASLSVAHQGKLELINSEIRTVDQTIYGGTCTRGYTVYVDGTLNAKNSRILYVSGNRSEFFRGSKASGVLDNVEIARTDGSALRLVHVDGSRLTLKNSRFITSNDYGLFVFGGTVNPLRVEDSVMVGTAADIFISRGTAELVLVDCRFSPSKVRFENASGTLHVKRRQRVVVLQAGKPAAGVNVVAENEYERVTGTTDADGAVVLEVTQQAITNTGSQTHPPHVYRAMRGGSASAETKPMAAGPPGEPMPDITLVLD